MLKQIAVCVGLPSSQLTDRARSQIRSGKYDFYQNEKSCGMVVRVLTIDSDKMYRFPPELSEKCGEVLEYFHEVMDRQGEIYLVDYHK